MPRFPHLPCLLVLLAGLLAGAPAAASGPPWVHADPHAEVMQLRIYQVRADSAPAFHARFRDHAARIMKRHGFWIVGAWVTRGRETEEFSYLLAWESRETMQRAWQAFLADAEWIRIKRDTADRDGPYVLGIEDRELRPVAYSPTVQR
jgi:heme-degrading monooxygenase HmoA